MKILIKIQLLMFFLISTSAASSASKLQYPGTNLRGRITTMYYNQQVPLVSAKVDLFYFNGNFPVGQQWRLIASTITDAYGFYFFRLITPQYYTIWVKEVKSYNIQVIPIDYTRFTYQDINQFIF
jgi:hypothetical protein